MFTLEVHFIPNESRRAIEFVVERIDGRHVVFVGRFEHVAYTVPADKIYSPAGRGWRSIDTLDFIHLLIDKMRFSRFGIVTGNDFLIDFADIKSTVIEKGRRHVRRTLFDLPSDEHVLCLGSHQSLR